MEEFFALADKLGLTVTHSEGDHGYVITAKDHHCITFSYFVDIYSLRSDELRDRACGYCETVEALKEALIRYKMLLNALNVPDDGTVSEWVEHELEGSISRKDQHMRPMTVIVAKMLIAPKLTAELANEWMDESDSLLWIENNIFNLISGIDWSINSAKGEELAEWVEHELNRKSAVHFMDTILEGAI